MQVAEHIYYENGAKKIHYMNFNKMMSYVPFIFLKHARFGASFLFAGSRIVFAEVYLKILDKLAVGLCNQGFIYHGCVWIHGF